MIAKFSIIPICWAIARLGYEARAAAAISKGVSIPDMSAVLSFVGLAWFILIFIILEAIWCWYEYRIIRKEGY